MSEALTATSRGFIYSISLFIWPVFLIQLVLLIQFSYLFRFALFLTHSNSFIPSIYIILLSFFVSLPIVFIIFVLLFFCLKGDLIPEGCNRFLSGCERGINSHLMVLYKVFCQCLAIVNVPLIRNGISFSIRYLPSLSRRESYKGSSSEVRLIGGKIETTLKKSVKQKMVGSLSKIIFVSVYSFQFIYSSLLFQIYLLVFIY